MSGSIGYHIAQWRHGAAVSFHVLFNLKIQRRFHASDAMLLVVTLRKLVFFLSSLHHSRHASCYAEHTAVRLYRKSGFIWEVLVNWKFSCQETLALLSLYTFFGKCV